MNRRLIPFVCVLAAIAALSLAAHPPRSTPSDSSPEASRTFEFTYQVHFPATADLAGPVRLWLPLPPSDGFQDVRVLHIDCPVKYSQGHDPIYKNRYAMFKPTPQQAAAGFDVTVRFTATRLEHKVSLDDADIKNASAASASDPMLKRYLEPDTLVPLDGTIAALAKEHTAGDTTQIEKARHIYEYVVSTMRYDKTGEGWGRGDAVWACTSKRGNCTDFHSLFIGMMRSSGIPARFEIGFPLPIGKAEGEIPGYHCWAEFYSGGVWVPVDASEASKHPDRHDYYFGHLDAARVAFTMGRDLVLKPPQNGEPLNYLIYPYAELDGTAVPQKQIKTKFSYADAGA
jgi:transglutaminase-like putative cysteine protease